MNLIARNNASNPCNNSACGYIAFGRRDISFLRHNVSEAPHIALRASDIAFCVNIAVRNIKIARLNRKRGGRSITIGNRHCPRDNDRFPPFRGIPIRLQKRIFRANRHSFRRTGGTAFNHVSFSGHGVFHAPAAASARNTDIIINRCGLENIIRRHDNLNAISNLGVKQEVRLPMTIYLESRAVNADAVLVIDRRKNIRASSAGNKRPSGRGLPVRKGDIADEIRRIKLIHSSPTDCHTKV